jgi:predicted small lipoprotein YifL
MKLIRLALVIPVLWLSTGCGTKTPPPATEIDASTQAEIEAHDRSVDDAESAQD